MELNYASQGVYNWGGETSWDIPLRRETQGEDTRRRSANRLEMLRLLILAAVLVAGQVAAQEVCTEIIVTGDDAEASCTCTCTCDVDCPTTPVPTTTPAPTTTLPVPMNCTAGIVSKNGVSTFDGNQFTLDTNNKFLVSQYNAGADDTCKFQVRIDTEDAPDGTGPQVGWAGVAFGVHDKNSAKFERNFRVSLKQGVVEVRGRGYNPTPVPTGPGVQNYESAPMALAGSTFTVMVSSGEYDIWGKTPARGCWFHVHYEEGSNGANDRVEIEVSDFYNGQLKGICGNRDGDPADDGKHCPVITDPPSEGCIDGAHQYNG